MRAGATLNIAALEHGYSPATIWRWIHQDEMLIVEYEKLKVQRSRALIEHALYEMQQASTLEQAKLADRKAMLYLRMAAKLNPKEFSDRMHSPILGKNSGSGRVSFTLNIGGPTNTSAQSMGELQVIEQSEDGEE
jgi:hypothetical protein